MALPQQNPFLGSAYPQLSTLGILPGAVAPGQLNPYLTQSITGTTPQWQPNLLTPSLLPGTLPSQNLYTQNFLQPQVAFAPQPQLQAINFIPPQPAVKSTVEPDPFDPNWRTNAQKAKQQTEETKEIVKAVESSQGELDALVQKLHNQAEEIGNKLGVFDILDERLSRELATAKQEEEEKRKINNSTNDSKEKQPNDLSGPHSAYAIYTSVVGLAHENEQLRQRLAAAESTVVSQREKIAQITQSQTKLISDTYEREGREKPFEENIRKLSEENLSQKNTIFDLKSQIKELEIKLDRSKKEAQTVKDQSAEREVELQQANQRRKEAETKADSARDALRERDEMVFELQRTLEAAKRRAGTQSHELEANLEAANRDLAAARDETRRIRTAAESEVRRLREALEEQQRHVDALRDDARSRLAAMELTHRQGLSAADDAVQAAKADLASAERRVEALTRDRARFEADIERMRADHESEMRRVRAMYTDQISALQSRLGNSNSAPVPVVAQSSKQVDELNEKLKKTTAELAAALERVSQLESSASASASASSNAEALQKEINKLRTQLEIVGTRGEQKNKLAARQADEIESLQHELQQQKDSSKTAVQSIMNSVYVTLRDQLGRVNRPLSAEEVLQAAAQIIRSCTIDGLAQLEKSAAATSEKEETEKEGEQEATPVAVEAKREAEGVVSAAPVTAAAVSSPAPPKKEEPVAAASVASPPVAAPAAAPAAAAAASPAATASSALWSTPTSAAPNAEEEEDDEFEGMFQNWASTRGRKLF